MWKAVCIAILSLCLAACVPSPGREGYQLRKLTSDTAGGGDSAISPDGRSFLTSLRRTGNWDIWEFQIDKGMWRQMTADPADEFEAQWSPDGQRIVYTSTKTGNKDIFLKDLRTGETHQLTDDPEDDEYPVFSPQGNEISFTGGRWKEGRQFFTVRDDGSSRRAISTQQTQAGACSFHPSGDSLICHTYDSGSGNVYLYPRAGGQRLRITDGPFWDYKPTIAPSGKWAAFSRSHEGPSAIWVMPFPVGAAFPLTSTGYDDRWPTWNRDGNRLLFHRLADQGTGIFLHDLTTGTSQQLTGPEDRPGPASMHPDGRRVIYSARSGDREHLKMYDLANQSGEEIRLQLSGDYDASFPRWSPKGDLIAFALRTGTRWDVAIADWKTAKVTVLTKDIPSARGIRSALDWSPDGKQVVFHVTTEPFEAGLYLADVHTGRLRNLTQDHWYSEAPSFTPDGKAITFMSTRGGNWTWGFFRMNLADGKVQLLHGPDYVEKNYPRLNRAGTLLWSQFDPDGREFLAVKRDGGQPTLLREAGPGARWPSFDAGGRRILYTRIAHSVEYWLADNLNSESSPLHDKGTLLSEAASCDRMPPGGGPNRSAQRASPVQMHHR